ncbi:hypothetical protein FP026_06230 [Rhizobium tropici]|uniref:DUF1127 domain-containing protein n=1 Tax=Rhizobium tropici TaxID=398 RepID=A0A5B0WBA8_RHITR|nr:hypothetical protein [Rhizobium tropici]KAA1183635.1 hypothetical protein FP026_06230 [Rhizobium tropici]
MSVIHAYNEIVDRQAPVSIGLPIAAIKSVLTMIARRAACLFARVQYMWTMRLITRFSAHRLRDIGFERDWDGSLIRAGGPMSMCNGQ